MTPDDVYHDNLKGAPRYRDKERGFSPTGVMRLVRDWEGGDRPDIYLEQLAIDLTANEFVWFRMPSYDAKDLPQPRLPQPR